MMDIRYKGLVLGKEELRVTDFESCRDLPFGFSRSIRRQNHRLISGNPTGCYDEPLSPLLYP